MEWSNWDKKAAECCPKGYEGTFSRCQSCGEPQRWGPERVQYGRTYIDKRRLEDGWEAGVLPDFGGPYGEGPTKAVALQDLKEKVWQREGEERARKAIEAAAAVPRKVTITADQIASTFSDWAAYYGPGGDIIYQGTGSVSRGVRDKFIAPLEAGQAAACLRSWFTK